MDFCFEIVASDKIKRYFCTINSYFVFSFGEKLKTNKQFNKQPKLFRT